MRKGTGRVQGWRLDYSTTNGRQLSAIFVIIMICFSAGVLVAIVVRPVEAQSVEWTRTFGSAQFDFPTGIVVDGSGTYVAGVTNGSLPGQSSFGGLDGFLRKYDPNGNEIWTRQLGTPAVDFVTGIAADASGVYLAGATNGTIGPTQGPTGDLDAFVRKYDPAGNIAWTSQFGYPNADGALGVAVDDRGIYVAGLRNQTFPGQTVERSIGTVSLLDLDGRWWGTYEFGFESSENWFVRGISTYASGIYVAGAASESEYQFVARLDRGGGGILWTRELGTGQFQFSLFSPLTVDADASGVYALNGTEVRNYDHQGNPGWTRQVSTSPFLSVYGLTVYASAVYVAGLNFSIGVYDIDASVWKYDKSDGNQIWTHHFGISDYDFALAISVDTSGIYVAGYTSDSSFLNVDGFVAKLTEAPPSNNPPSLVGPASPVTGKELSEISFTINASDPNAGQTVAIVCNECDSRSATFISTQGNPAAGTFSWTPSTTGSFDFTFVATDNGTPTMSDTRTVTVIVGPEVNHAPSLTGPTLLISDELSEISPGSPFIASDPDAGQTVTMVCNECASRSATFISTPGNPAYGVFHWTPTEAQGADNDYVFTFVASDDGSPVISATGTMTVHVNEVNQPPVLASIGDRTVQETTTLSFTAAASDGDLPEQPLTFSIEPPASGDFPMGATMTATGVFSWTPTSTQGPGLYRARIFVSDGLTEDFEEITITVTEAPINNPPVLVSIGNKQLNEEAILTFTASATDPDVGQTLTLTATGLPTGASFSPSGTFTWTPTEAQGPGTYTIIITATDNGSPQMAASETIVITVSEVNQAPVLPALTSRTVTQGSQLTFTVTANDLDIPHTLAYTLEPGAPPGASVSASGVFSWTPTDDQVPGTYTITVRVSDGTASDTETFTVIVNARQQTPSAPPSFWQQYWYVLLIMVLAVAGIPVAVKLRGKSEREKEV